MFQTPLQTHKFIFWLLLGALSTVFAEVPAASDLFPLFTFWGLTVVFPIYALHILVLGNLVTRRVPVRWQTLYFAGILFGLYEAYMTKIVWQPNWDTLIPTIGGVLPFEMLVIVFFWHPIFSFILPMMLAERFLTGSDYLFHNLPGIVQKLLASPRKTFFASLLLAVALGTFQTMNAPSVQKVLLSGFSNGLFLIGTFWLWRHQVKPIYALPDLMPSRRALTRLAIALALLYVILGVLINPQALPGWQGHLTIWIVYFITILLLWRSLRKPCPIANPISAKPTAQLSALLLPLVVFTLSAFLAKTFLPTTGNIFGMIGWVVMALCSLVMFTSAVISTLRPTK
ncbi:MAG: hypothetical protein CVU39_23150 [Chloroflexi bacterium HGW-Chloroflexi-10]|nr:MAG: hypothetical protein CVU39_23150 [Chloroflexi bacterium HGW-Chloroflexi-10]